MIVLTDKFLNEKQEPSVFDYISTSRINLWLKCPLAFRRRYLDGIKSTTTPNLFVGKVVHDVLDSIYRCAMVGAYTTTNDVPAFAETSWQRLMESEPCTFESAEQEMKCRNQVDGLVTAYLSEIDITAEKPLAVEQKYETSLIDPFTGEGFGMPLLGVVDLILDGGDGPIIIDFKTAASASSNCELQHELQLTAYAYLIREVLGITESELQIRQLVKTKVPKIVVHRYPPRTDEHFERFFGIIREYLNGIDGGIFNYRPSWNCGLCEHCGSCVSVSHSVDYKESKQNPILSFVTGG